METWDDAAAIFNSPRGYGSASFRSPRGSSASFTSPRGNDAGFTSPRGMDAGFNSPGTDAMAGYEAAWVAPWQRSQEMYNAAATASAEELVAQATALDAENAKNNPAPGTTVKSSNPTVAGKGGTADWAAMDAWNPKYDASSKTTGTPANVIKAVQAVETGRFWKGDMTGEENCEVRPESGCLALNTGMYEATADSWGIDYDKMLNDPDYAVEAMGIVLNEIAQADAGEYNGTPGKTVLEEGGWLGVAMVYHGGDITGNFMDENGVVSTEYKGHVETYLNDLGGVDDTTAVGADVGSLMLAPEQPRPGFSRVYTDGSVRANAPGGTAAPPLDYIWGGGEMEVVSDMGSTDGAPTGDSAYYDYSKELGFTGNPGVDYAVPVGTAINAPVAGTVVNLGGDYFKDPQGIGDVRVQAENGDVIILGNMRTANFKVGDQIKLGDIIGTSGAPTNNPEDGALHLEVRVLQPDGTYRAANPEEYFGGGRPATGSVVTPERTADVTSDPKGKDIADLADNYLNVPYYLGSLPRAGEDPYETGWDCSGFVSYIAETLGISWDTNPEGIPDGSHPQAAWAIKTGRWRDGNDVSQLQPGDVVFFDTGLEGGGGQYDYNDERAINSSHVGIYLGDGKMINAMQECTPGLTMGVDCGTGIVDIANDTYWNPKMLGSATMY